MNAIITNFSTRSALVHVIQEPQWLVLDNSSSTVIVTTEGNNMSTDWVLCAIMNRYTVILQQNVGRNNSTILHAAVENSPGQKRGNNKVAQCNKYTFHRMHFECKRDAMVQYTAKTDMDAQLISIMAYLESNACALFDNISPREMNNFTGVVFCSFLICLTASQRLLMPLDHTIKNCDYRIYFADAYYYCLSQLY